MQARSAVQCRSARLSEAVSPAKSARVAIGLIVVKSVAKSLLILIKSGDICRSVCFILLRTTYQALARFWRATAHDRTREMISFRFNSQLSALNPRLPYTNGGSSARQSWRCEMGLIRRSYKAVEG